jgi:two-component system chemotaxis response regulator CheB
MIKVLVVDDSELIRKMLVAILSEDEQIEVVGTAIDPIDARAKIKLFNPDVITLDIEMPRMDGITFLKNLIRLRPIPVVMISTLTEKGANITFEALQIGAVDFIPKPKLDVRTNLATMAYEVCSKVKSAAGVDMASFINKLSLENERQDTPQVLDISKPSNIEVIVIGASTGGTEALKRLLSQVPGNMPPILIVQHMPPGFTLSFANRLNSQLGLEVSEFNATELEPKSGHAYIANGSQHMLLQKRDGRLFISQENSEPVNRHKPSVDVLFESAAQCCGRQSIAVILTGMGVDGADGMATMRHVEAETIAQDESSSVVWGMPKAAVDLGAAKYVLALDDIGSKLISLCGCEAE